MPTALRLAPKSTLVVIVRIYAQAHSQALTSQIYVRILIICRYVVIYSSLVLDRFFLYIG